MDLGVDVIVKGRLDVGKMKKSRLHQDLHFGVFYGDCQFTGIHSISSRDM
jgi:hypothetical protein